MTARLVDAAVDRLASAHKLYRQRKTLGGSASDDHMIGQELAACGFLPDEILALRRTKSLNGAARFLVAKQTHREPSTIRTAVNRSRRKEKEKT